MWIGPISVLLAPFQVQLYLEKDRAYSASIWGDFSNIQRPHPDDKDYSVDLALKCGNVDLCASQETFVNGRTFVGIYFSARDWQVIPGSIG